MDAAAGGDAWGRVVWGVMNSWRGGGRRGSWLGDGG